MIGRRSMFYGRKLLTPPGIKSAVAEVPEQETTGGESEEDRLQIVAEILAHVVTETAQSESGSSEEDTATT